MAMPNLLSLNFLVPFVAGKIDFTRAIRGMRGMQRRLLLVGHKLAAGTLAVNTLTTISNEPDAIARLGEGSMLLSMWRAARANADLGLPIDVIAISLGGSAVAATSALVVGGAPSAAGEVMLYIGGERVSTGVTVADTSATIATKLGAAVNALAKLQVTAAVVASTVTLTARTPGPNSNDIDVRSIYYAGDVLATGVTLATPVMAGGAVSPDVTPVIVAMNLYRATEIVSPFTDSTNMGLFENELATRWLQNNMQDGMLVNCLRGTEAVITTWLNARNSPHVHTIAVTNDCTNPWETAAMAGAAIESSAAIDPSVGPTAKLLGYKGPTQGNGFVMGSLNNLLTLGGSPLNIAADYTGSLLRMVTNYKLSPGGAPDRSMAEMCWLKTMSYYRWYRVTEFMNKYNNMGYKLAQYVTQPIPGQKIMTVDLAKDIMIGLYKVFCDNGLCQNMPYYISTLNAEIDAPNGKLKIMDEPVILTQHYQTEITSNVVAGQV
jgi:phage tail sheath gpL-like